MATRNTSASGWQQRLWSALPLFFIAAILCGTLIPGWVIAELLEWTGQTVLFEKLGHVTLFAGLAACLAARMSPNLRAVAIAGALALGAATELGQFLAIGRDPSVRDFALDGLGIFFGQIAAVRFGRKEGSTDPAESLGPLSVIS